MAYQQPPSTASREAVAYYDWVKSQRVPIRTRKEGFEYLQDNKAEFVDWDTASDHGAILLGSICV